MPTARRSKNRRDSGDSNQSRLVLPILLLALIAAAGYLLVGQLRGPNAAATPQAARAVPPPAVFDPPQIDFGEMPLNVTQTKTARILNTGRAPLQILTTRTSCTCTRIETPMATINPGAGELVTIHMDSQTRPGARNVTASVFFVGYEQPVTLSVQRVTVEE